MFFVFSLILRWEFLDLESDQPSSGTAQAQALKFLDFATLIHEDQLSSAPHSTKLATLNLITRYLKTCEKITIFLTWANN